mgnify:CR=1 FL=1
MKSRGKVKTEDPTPCEKAKLLLEQAEQEIFGNISQCVCLAKLQIAQMEINKKEEAMARIGEACLLLGKAVKDLRNLARQLNSFQP